MNSGGTNGLVESDAAQKALTGWVPDLVKALAINPFTSKDGQRPIYIRGGVVAVLARPIT